MTNLFLIEIAELFQKKIQCLFQSHLDPCVSEGERERGRGCVCVCVCVNWTTNFRGNYPTEFSQLKLVEGIDHETGQCGNMFTQTKIIAEKKPNFFTI